MTVSNLMSLWPNSNVQSCCRYLVLVQKLQLTYRMEPAGSQGVWNLDDYQFIPFIWGSSQLLGSCLVQFCSHHLGNFSHLQPCVCLQPGRSQVCFDVVSDHKRILPKSFPDPDISSTFAKDYMFLGCINHINKVKFMSVSVLGNTGSKRDSYLKF